MRRSAAVAVQLVLAAILTPIVKVVLDVCDLTVPWRGAVIVAVLGVATGWAVAFRLDWRNPT